MDTGQIPDRPETPSTSSQKSPKAENGTPASVPATDAETKAYEAGWEEPADTSGWGAPDEKSLGDTAADVTWEDPSPDAGWGEPSGASGWEAATADASNRPNETKPRERNSGNNKEGGNDREKDRKPREKPNKPKITGYIRPELQKKEKMSAEELEAMMARMKLKNDQIREQRERVAADEDAFNAKVKEERERQKKIREQQQAKATAQKKIQTSIDNEREENAKRKLAKLAQREWDSQKQSTPERKERPLKGLGRGAPISSSDVRQPNTPITPKTEEAPQLPELEKNGLADEWAAATAAATEQW